MPQLTFNPGLTLIGFRTTRPWGLLKNIGNLALFNRARGLYWRILTEVVFWFVTFSPQNLTAIDGKIYTAIKIISANQIREFRSSQCL